MKKLIVLSFFIGAVIGFIAPLLIWAFVNDSAYQFLYEFQTFIAGIIAFSGAWITVTTMRKHQSDRIFSESLASRSTLTDAQTAMHVYLRKCFDYTSGECETLSRAPKSIVLYKQHIQYSDKKTAQNLFCVACFLQLYHSRLQSHKDSTAVNKKPSDILSDILTLAHAITNFWDYARGIDVDYEIPRITMNSLYETNNEINRCHKITHSFVEDYISKLTSNDLAKLNDATNYSARKNALKKQRYI